MASKSLHESSSVTETSKEKDSVEKSNIHRQAKSHYTVRVGAPKHYADSDFVKPHESHAHLNLSHVMVTDDQGVEASLQDQSSSLSETVIHRPSSREALSLDNISSSDDEETGTISKSTQGEGNPTQDTETDQQGTNTAPPASTNEDITGSISSISLDTNSIHSDPAAAVSSSWSSITNIEETFSAENNLEHPETKPPEKEAEMKAQQEKNADNISTSPGRNRVMAVFKAGLFAVRRNAVVEDQEKPVTEELTENLSKKESSSSGDDVDKLVEKAHPTGKEQSLETSHVDTMKKESSAEIQQPASDEVMDEIKEATVVGLSRGSDDTKASDTLDNNVENVRHQLEESYKSNDTAESAYEILEMQSDEGDEDEGFTTAYTLPNVTDYENECDASTNDAAASKQDPTQKTLEDQDMVATNERLQTQGVSKSDSSVEVIYNVKKDSSSLDGLAIAEERESRESNKLQQETDEVPLDKIASLKDELKSSKDETLRLKQQLDVQLMCEKYVRNEAEEEIQKAERKINILQSQINKPPKLINKYRKELRRIFQAIESEGGPNKVWTTAEGLQQAIRFLYQKKKDMELLLHETEQHLQNTQSECSAWKRRAKEQESTNEQLMNDLEGLQAKKLLLNKTSSKSDTCLSYGTMDQTSISSESKFIWGLQETPKKVVVNEMVEELKQQNFQLRQQLTDVQTLAQKWQKDLNEAKEQADLMKSKVDMLNSELIHERLHSQHLSTKLHNHNISAKSSRLWGLAEDLNDSTPPLEEAVRANGTSMGDIDGLEDWLGHLKAEQQHTITELQRHQDELKVLHSQVHHLEQQNNSGEKEADKLVTEVDVGVTREKEKSKKKTITPVAELKLWQELHQLRDVQLETLKDLDEKDNKISDLQQRYSEILAEHLQQRAKLEIDLEDNRSEKQVIQDQLEETQQLVKELHRKCVQLSQALEEAHNQMASQEEIIQELKKQFAAVMADKQQKVACNDEENRKEDELKKRVKLLEEDAKQIAASEKSLRKQLELCLEDNKQLQEQFGNSSSLDDKFLNLYKELEEIREAEQQFHNKYSLQDKEIHHLHHYVSAIQTGMKQMVEEVVDTTLDKWQQEKTVLQAQLVKTLSAVESSEQSRKATEDLNKTLMINGSKLEESYKTLTKQLEQEWMGHQKTVDKLNQMQSMLSQQEQTKAQMHHENEDLVEWEHQLKEEAQRLSAQLHRIMGNHDQQVRTMREANTRLMGNLKMNVPPYSYHDNVSSARAKLQFLLSNSSPSSATAQFRNTTNDTTSVNQPHRNPYTAAQGLQTMPEDLQTTSAAPLRRNQQRPGAAFTTYTESYHFPS